MTKVKPHQRKRAWAPKSRSGCTTCRGICESCLSVLGSLRRVKCDETVPICLKCSRGGFKCDGVSFGSGRAHHDGLVLIQNPVSSLALLSSGEDARAFDFFQANGISMLSNGFGCDFWERLVIQTAHANPGIFRSIIALSTLLEDFTKWQMNWGAGLRAPMNEKTKLALNHYGLALRQLSSDLQGSESMNVISLTSCLLFSCIEALIGNIAGSANLANVGLKILCQAESENIDIESHSPLRSFWSVFMQADSLFVQMQRIRAPEYQAPFISRPFHTMPSSFSNPREATYYLNALVNMSKRLGSATEDPTARPRNLEACRVLFVQWNSAFHQLVHHIKPADESERRRLCLCHVWRLDTRLTLYGPQEGAPEVEWDKHEQSFRELLKHASTLSRLDSQTHDDNLTSFALGGGIFFPIAGLGFRCRDPKMRRAAISLLFRHSHAEGPLLGPIAARFIQKVVAIEEHGLGQVLTSADVPESARVNSFCAHLRGKGNGAEVSYSRLDPETGVRVTVYDAVLGASGLRAGIEQCRVSPNDDVDAIAISI
ncbi:hypothetical protein BKA56DRAFT_681221 [Ilyonectria sp. MPI-CAGE-AT-0026]|nr:hypothetical protein BKA56DRAFT_681221 [Ilyonectria sp. MPI-CAGE-AT-0026]